MAQSKWREMRKWKIKKGKENKKKIKESKWQQNLIKMYGKGKENVWR